MPDPTPTQAPPANTPPAPAAPKVPTPSAGKPEALAGVYQLAVDVWNELKSAPGQAKRFAKHVKGDIIELDEATAARLLRGGAVKPTSSDQEQTTAAEGGTRLATATAAGAAGTGQQSVTAPGAPSSLTTAT